jgi:ribose 5-phosphate isomerase A
VIEMAREQVARRFRALGGNPVLRVGVTTDNGHPLLDVHGLSIADPLAMETEINQWPGVVTVGIFARHRASLCLLGTPLGVQTLRFQAAAKSA